MKREISKQVFRQSGQVPLQHLRSPRIIHLDWQLRVVVPILQRQ